MPEHVGQLRTNSRTRQFIPLEIDIGFSESLRSKIGLVPDCYMTTDPAGFGLVLRVEAWRVNTSLRDNHPICFLRGSEAVASRISKQKSQTNDAKHDAMACIPHRWDQTPNLTSQSTRRTRAGAIAMWPPRELCHSLVRRRDSDRVFVRRLHRRLRGRNEQDLRSSSYRLPLDNRRTLMTRRRNEALRKEAPLDNRGGREGGRYPDTTR